MPVNIHNTDYIYKRTYNASISNNQSKDFASHYDVYMSRAKLLLPFMYFFFTAIIYIPHCTAQMMDSERAGVFTDRCINLLTSNA